MKSSLVCLAILASLVLAQSSIEGHIEGVHIPMPATDAIIDTNAYDADHVYSTAFAIFSDYWVADDFTNANLTVPEELIFWALTTGVNPTDMDVYFWADGAPGPGVELHTENVSGSNLTLTYCGVTFAGYPVFILEASLTGYFDAAPGTTFWTTVQRDDGSNLYAIMDDEVAGSECYRDIGSGWVPGSSAGYDPTDMFRIIFGWVAPLDRDTWGSIKKSF